MQRGQVAHRLTVIGIGIRQNGTPLHDQGAEIHHLIEKLIHEHKVFPASSHAMDSWTVVRVTVQALFESNVCIHCPNDRRTERVTGVEATRKHAFSWSFCLGIRFRLETSPYALLVEHPTEVFEDLAACGGAARETARDHATAFAILVRSSTTAAGEMLWHVVATKYLEQQV